MKEINSTLDRLGSKFIGLLSIGSRTKQYDLISGLNTEIILIAIIIID